jgi:hypothetical protein
MRIALLIGALLTTSVLVPLPAHAQGAVPSAMSFYSASEFTGVVCPRKVGTNTEMLKGTLAFDGSGSFRCDTREKSEFVIPYASVKRLVYEDHVEEPGSALSRHKYFHSRRLTIFYTDGDGQQEQAAVWFHSQQWRLALQVASNKTGKPIEQTERGGW